MNRYPFWKYALIGLALLLGALYALPNFFGEAPAVQVSPGKASVKVDESVLARVEQALHAIEADRITEQGGKIVGTHGHILSIEAI